MREAGAALNILVKTVLVEDIVDDGKKTSLPKGVHRLLLKPRKLLQVVAFAHELDFVLIVDVPREQVQHPVHPHLEAGILGVLPVSVARQLLQGLVLGLLPHLVLHERCKILVQAFKK